jgi:hypothetical protein
MLLTKKRYALVKNKTLPKIGIVIFAFLLFGIVRAEAATLSVSPSSVSTSVGKTISVKVVVGSAGQSINAVSGQINFSNDLLTLSSISKGSLVTLWAQEPTFSNGNGTASFQGVILNGYTGSGGTIITLNFKAKAQGSATVGITNGGSSVLLNDGQGTNVLSGTTGGTITIAKAVVVTPPPQTTTTPPPVVTPPPVIETPPPVVEKQAPEPIRAPIFTDYQNPLTEGSFIVVKGTTSPNTSVNITFNRTLADGSTTVTQIPITSNDTGTFTFVSDQKVADGAKYILTATTSDNQHTDPLTLSTKTSFWGGISNVIASILAVKISLILALFIMLLVVGYLVYRNLVLRERLEEFLRDRPTHTEGQ